VHCGVAEHVPRLVSIVWLRDYRIQCSPYVRNNEGAFRDVISSEYFGFGRLVRDPYMKYGEIIHLSKLRFNACNVTNQLA
jgi:hypothetical protein